MRVNQGLIQFYIGPDTTIEDMSRAVLKLTNTSNAVVNKKLGQIFAKSGRFRMQALPEAKGPVNVGNDQFLSNKMISNINSQWMLSSILKNISTYPKYNSKGVAIIYFMNNGFHLQFPEIFHLEIRPESFSDNLSPQLLKSIIDDNITLNKFITEYIESTNEELSKDWQSFYEGIKPLCKDEEYYEAIENMGFRIGDATLTDSWNTTTMIANYIQDDKFNEFNELFKELRVKTARYTNPTLQDLCGKFWISLSTYKRNKIDVLNTIVSTFGPELCKEVIK